MMLFRRREEESLWERARVHMWPRRSWARSTRYITYRLSRLSASPHAIALGFAAGCFAAITPLLGCHVIMAALVSWALGGSIVASFFGTFLGNPLTYPVVWYSSYKIGTFFIGTPPHVKNVDFSGEIFASSWDHIWPILKPTLLGSLPIGVVVAAVAYFLMKALVEAYQERRRRRFQLRHPRRSQAVSAQ
jgi:uncharacterized protein (DUF2062 family)